jgi:CobQ-like glutamine amidotransferase family enzyme
MKPLKLQRKSSQNKLELSNMAKQKLTITHLYPELMNLYGDLGNVICLRQRSEWRGIDVEVKNVGIGDKLPADTDIYFFGGGQDNDQLLVFKDLVETKKQKLVSDINAGVAFLAICGGYQLLGEYFLDSEGNRIEGIGVLPLETVSPGQGMVNRAVGNLITDVSAQPGLSSHYSGLKTLVGFENHSGRTRFTDASKISPLGKVLTGYGDNEDQVSDGALFQNTIGSYMHGSVLPKNPHLADFLISKALERKYGASDLARLDDAAEIAAHNYMLKRYNLS